MADALRPLRSQAAQHEWWLSLGYVLPPLLACLALLISIQAVPLPFMFMAMSLVLGWTQIINYCGLAHTCALTQPVRNRQEAIWWLRPITAYTLAGCVSAAITGAFLGSVGMLTSTFIPGWAGTVLVVGVALLVISREVGVARFPLPEVRRQTRARWFTDRPLLNPAAWGFDVGFAFLTWQVLSGAYFLAVVVVLSGSPVLGIGTFCSYWLGRALPHWLEPLIIPDPSRAYLYAEQTLNARRALGVIHALGVLVGTLALVFA
jgi:hypothetical protein